MPLANPATNTPPALPDGIEIFRAGRHIDDQGVEHSFSEADLDGMAASYNPALREAPLTVGHPQNDLPAYGWVKGVARSASGALAINPHQVEPQFAEMVQAGRFKKRSASFYPPQAPNNPTPGRWYLRHVAFLGAQPPAVAGLKDIQFSAGDADGAVNFMDGMPKGSAGSDTGASVRKRLHELVAAGASLEEISRQLARMGANASRSAGTLSAILSGEIANPPDTLLGFLKRVSTANFSESASGAPTPKEQDDMDEDLKTQLAATQAQLKTEQDARAKAETDAATHKKTAIDAQAQAASFAEKARTDRKAGFVSFADAQVTAGRLLPKDKAMAVATLDALADCAPVEFAEGDTTRKVGPAQWLQDLIAQARPQVSFGEFAPGSDGSQAQAGGAKGKTDAEIDVAAKTYARQHKVSYAEALGAVTSFTS